MSRVSTFGNYQSALLNLFSAQGRQQDASNRLSTQKVATDLTGFGRTSETLTALKGSQSRLTGFIDTADVVSSRLVTQDLALTQINDALGAATSAITSVVGLDSVGTLMQELEGAFQSVMGGLNFKHQGNYLFGGANNAVAPVALDDLAALADEPVVADIFNNDGLIPKSRLAEGTTIETGFLASDVGQEIVSIFRDIQLYHEGPNGPFTGQATAAQKTFLTDQLGRLKTASGGVVDNLARNGSLQKQVETVGASQLAQRSALEALVADKTDANVAQAITDLELANVAVEASARVVSQLSEVTLLNYLR